MQKKSCKKIVLLFVIFSICVLLVFFVKNYYNYLKIKNAKVIITYKDDLTCNFKDEKKVSSFINSINGKIINDYVIDTSKLGIKKVNFKFINDDGIKLNSSFNINIVDNVAPVIWLNNSYSIVLGDNSNLESKILCGDNYDNDPVCKITGTYDFNTIGSYPLHFTATDSSGNETSKDFILNVIKKTNKKNTVSNIYFSDVIDKYKSDNIKFGIDVSKWQGDIDFSRVKKAGASFVIIKIGGSLKSSSNYYLDPYFEYNISNAIKNDLEVGVYFYSSASSTKESQKEAKWVLNKIKGYKVDLPIAFDWENFSSFNDYSLSFFGLTQIADSFIESVEKQGYKGMIYGSKNYLENIWMIEEQDIWLAHYTSKTNYEKKHKFWQLCDNGKIDGIDSFVDIDIMYVNN